MTKYAAGEKLIALGELMRRDGCTCALCGRPVDPRWAAYPLSKSAPAIGHLVAPSAGGSRRAMSNQRLVHRYCASTTHQGGALRLWRSIEVPERFPAPAPKDEMGTWRVAVLLEMLAKPAWNAGETLHPDHPGFPAGWSAEEIAALGRICRTCGRLALWNVSIAEPNASATERDLGQPEVNAPGRDLG
jgi:hypothetical protein